MSAIRGRPPKDRDAIDKAEALRSPKASDLSADAAKRDEKRDKDPKEKDKKERTRALDDLAPPVAPRVSPSAVPTGTHHSRTQTAPVVSRPSIGGSMVVRPSASLSSSDGAARSVPLVGSDSSDRRRLTISGVGSSRASVSGSTRDAVDDKDKVKDKPRARDDDVLSDARRERNLSISANDALRRPKPTTLPTSPVAAVNDLHIVKQPKPYQDPRLSVPGSPDATARSPTISRASLAGGEKDSTRKEKKERDKTEKSDTGDPDARPSRRTQREGDKEKEAKDAKDKEARDREKEREAKEKDAKDKEVKDKEEKTVRSSSGGSRISRTIDGSRGSRIGETPPASPLTVSQPALSPFSPLSPLSSPASSPVTSAANKPAVPVNASGTALGTSPSSPATISSAKPTVSPALTPPPMSPTVSLSSSNSSSAPPSPAVLPAFPLASAGSAPTLVGVVPLKTGSGTPPMGQSSTKDDISMGDRLKLFMNSSPRASQSMLNMSSPQLQALREKHTKSTRTAAATEPMDLKDVVLKMRDPNYGLELKETKIGFFTTKKCMTGIAFVDWLIAQKFTESGVRSEAVAIATALLNTGNIELAKAVNEKDKDKDMFSDSASLYTIPKSEDDKKKEKEKNKDLKDIHSPRSPRRRWFGASLPEIMAAQDPSEKAPRVVTALLNAVLFMNGSRTEGIFRISPEGSLIDTLKEQLERGNLTIPGHDPHVPACCFKLFLRELRQPVIPDALYDECVKAAESTAAVQEVVAKLPETNRNLLMTLVQFLVELASPDNIQVTKMPVSNLSVVFAPCLLRCPLVNPLDIMRNSSVEQMFVQTLIESQCPPTYVKVVMPTIPRTIAVPLKDSDGNSPMRPGSAGNSGKKMDFINGGTPPSSSPNNSGKALMMSTNIPLSAAITTIDVGMPMPRGESTGGLAASRRLTQGDASQVGGGAGGGRKDTGGSAGSSGKKIGPFITTSGASTPDGSTPNNNAPITENVVSSSMTKSEPVPIPSASLAAATGTPASSASTPLSSSTNTAVVSVSPSESFSAPGSPAVLVPPPEATDVTPQVALAPPRVSGKKMDFINGRSFSSAQNVAGQAQQPLPVEDTQLAQWLAAAEPTMAAKVGPQLRDVRQRLAVAEASKDLELASFYRTQADALRKQLGGEEKKAM